MMDDDTTLLHITLSGDVYLKSRRTQKGLIRRLLSNLEIALGKAGYSGSVSKLGSHRFSITPRRENTDAVRAAALSVFGVASVDTLVEVPFESFEGLAEQVANLSHASVGEKTFAVRVKRRGTHTWNSVELASAIGALIVEKGGRVNLSEPEVTVAVTVLTEQAFLVTNHSVGQGGLPIGSQDKVLCLISGGFDSVVAGWMLMSRGCAVDFVHFTLNCAQSDHALAVASEMWAEWGHGMKPTVHLVEFQPVKDALFEHVDPKMRQVALKVMMARAASSVALDEGIPALVTGDALGQVSSQTLPHLVAVSNASDVPILRPLVGLPKQSIIDLARVVGTAELSARAQEVCDLSEGRPVATKASQRSIDASVDRIPDEVMADALTTRKTFRLVDWSPGQF
jgi:thiamine biosynthesis protein ThiI